MLLSAGEALIPGGGSSCSLKSKHGSMEKMAIYMNEQIQSKICTTSRFK